MLTFFTLLIMLMVAYAYVGEGIFTACLMCINVLLAGLVAFEFWELLADALEPAFDHSMLQGYEDALSLVLLFSLSLGLLRLTTNTLVSTQVAYPGIVQRGGAGFFGLVIGYLVAGFLLCVLQTLPWHEHFLGYQTTTRRTESLLSRVLPADRVWLAAMRRAGAFPFAFQADPDAEEQVTPYDRYLTFDKYGTFVPRYARYRRYDDNRDALPYLGECDDAVHRRGKEKK